MSEPSCSVLISAGGSNISRVGFAPLPGDEEMVPAYPLQQQQAGRQTGFADSPWKRFKERRATHKGKGADPGRSPSPPPLFTTPTPGQIMPSGMTTAQPLLSAANPMNGRYIDLNDDQYHCQIKRPEGQKGSEFLDNTEKRQQRGTAVWEGALPHDSLDLLNFYLKALGIHRRTRAWMIMDLIENYDPHHVFATAKLWAKAYKTHESAETTPEARDAAQQQRLSMIKEMTAPYHELESSLEVWRASEGDWWDTGYVTTAGALIGAELDGFLWKMRQHRIGPMTRHAMLRDLMSQTTERSYRSLKEKIIKAVEGDEKTMWETEEQRKIRLDQLINEYNRKIQFARQKHISQEEIYYDRKAMKENRVPRKTQNEVLRKKRWGLSKEPWQVLLRKLETGQI